VDEGQDNFFLEAEAGFVSSGCAVCPPLSADSRFLFGRRVGADSASATSDFENFAEWLRGSGGVRSR